MDIHFAFTPIQQTLLCVTLALLCIEWLYLYLLYTLPSRRASGKGKQPKCAPSPQPVSVVVTTSDYNTFLVESLTQILEQDYPDFEVILVHDGAISDTLELEIAQLQAHNSHLYITHVPNEVRNISHRKLAVTLGIKAAKHDLVLFTHANCCPASSQWIATMTRHFVDGVDLVLGYSVVAAPLQTKARYWAYDRFLFVTRFIVAAQLRAPYMGMGCNMAYRKSLFYSQNGFAKYLSLRAGEDDLFVYSVANRHNTRTELTLDARVEVSHTDLSEEWRGIKRNYVYTSRYIKRVSKWMLGCEMAFRYLYYGSIVVLALFAGNSMAMWVGVALAFLLFVVPFLLAYQGAVRHLSAPKLILQLSLFDLARPFVWMAARVKANQYVYHNFTRQVVKHP